MKNKNLPNFAGRFYFFVIIAVKFNTAKEENHHETFVSNLAVFLSRNFQN